MVPVSDEAMIQSCCKLNKYTVVLTNHSLQSFLRPAWRYQERSATDKGTRTERKSVKIVRQYECEPSSVSQFQHTSPLLRHIYRCSDDLLKAKENLACSLFIKTSWSIPTWCCCHQRCDTSPNKTTDQPTPILLSSAQCLLLCRYNVVWYDVIAVRPS